MDGNRLFADKGKYLGKKYGKFRVRKEIRSWMIGQGLTINSGKFSVVVVQEVYPAVLTGVLQVQLLEDER